MDRNAARHARATIAGFIERKEAIRKASVKRLALRLRTTYPREESGQSVPNPENLILTSHI
jgi:hypothetical protein